jgi:hypothetical protein
MELQNQRKAPLRKARPATSRPDTGKSGPGSQGGFRRLLPMDLDKNVRLILAALLFVGSTWWALTRFSRPDPFRKPDLFSWAWFVHPLEANAPARLPVVSGTLTTLAVVDGRKELLVAGQQGLVLRYKASNQQWENLSIPDSLGRGRVAPASYGPGAVPRVSPRRWENRGPRTGSTGMTADIAGGVQSAAPEKAEPGSKGATPIESKPADPYGEMKK